MRARAVLGAAGRVDAAMRYDRLKSICDRIAYHPVDVPAEATIVPSGFADGAPDAMLDIRESAGIGHLSGVPVAPFGKIWRHDHALLARLLIIAALLCTLIIFFAGSIGIAEVLSRLFAG